MTSELYQGCPHVEHCLPKVRTSYLPPPPSQGHSYSMEVKHIMEFQGPQSRDSSHSGSWTPDFASKDLLPTLWMAQQVALPPEPQFPPR